MTHWKRFALVASVVVLLVAGAVGYSMLTAPSAKADATCGDTPDWWTPAYLSWEACEVSNGLMGALSQTEVINPLFQTISDTLNSVNSWVSDISGNVGSILTQVEAVPGQITSFFTPQDGDWQPLLDEMQTVRAREPFATVDLVTTYAGQLRDDWQSAASRFSPFSSVTPGDLASALCGGAVCSHSSSGYDFGPLSTGVLMWLWFMDQCGISQSTVAALFNVFIVMTTAYSILSEFGVRFGRLSPGGVSEGDRGGSFGFAPNRGRSAWGVAREARYGRINIPDWKRRLM